MGVDREANRAAPRVAVVTGVAQRIGRAVAEVLAHEGYAPEQPVTVRSAAITGQLTRIEYRHVRAGHRGR